MYRNFVFGSILWEYLINCSRITAQRILSQEIMNFFHTELFIAYTYTIQHQLYKYNLFLFFCFVFYRVFCNKGPTPSITYPAGFLNIENLEIICYIPKTGVYTFTQQICSCMKKKIYDIFWKVHIKIIDARCNQNVKSDTTHRIEYLSENFARNIMVPFFSSKYWLLISNYWSSKVKLTLKSII